jgi:hypothetical protein
MKDSDAMQWSGPGLSPQVGYTRLAEITNFAQLGQARVARVIHVFYSARV